MLSKYKTNVFSDDMFLKIKNFHSESLKKTNNAKYYNEVGRYYSVTSFPEDIAKSVIGKAEEETGLKDLEIIYVQAVRYQIKDGEVPSLNKHLDEVYYTYILDIAVGGTVEWPLIVEGEEFPSIPNSVVFLKGDSDEHFRPEYPSKSKEDYLDLVFVYLGHKGDKHVVAGREYLKYMIGN